MLRDKASLNDRRFDQIRKLVRKRKLALGQPFNLIAGDNNSPRGTLFQLATIPNHNHLWLAYGRLIMDIRRRGDLSPSEDKAIAEYQAEARRRKYDKSSLRGRTRARNIFTDVTPVELGVSKP